MGDVVSNIQYSFGNGAELDRTVLHFSETADKMAVLCSCSWLLAFSNGGP